MQAAQLAEQMQNMKPEHLEKLIAVGSALQGGLARLRRAREWVSRNSVLVAALLVLLLALLVRRWLARRSAADTGAAQLLHAATGEVRVLRRLCSAHPFSNADCYSSPSSRAWLIRQRGNELCTSWRVMRCARVTHRSRVLPQLR